MEEVGDFKRINVDIILFFDFVRLLASLKCQKANKRCDLLQFFFIS